MLSNLPPTEHVAAETAAAHHADPAATAEVQTLLPLTLPLNTLTLPLITLSPLRRC